MQRFIGQLTGVRFVAAAWVMLYHFQAPLAVCGLLIPVVAPTLRVGRLGVDLFFALSGFILTHTYLTKIGPRIERHATLRFYWLRLARIYPVHFLTLNLAGIAAVVAARVGSGDATGANPTKDWLNPVDYLKQVLLIQEWGPNPQRGWNYPAWSLSMEWLAYLLFPLLVLALFRWRERLATHWLALGWVAVLVPLLWYGIAYDSDPYYISGWGSTMRILTEFSAGALTYLIALRFTDGESVRPRVERLATTMSVALPMLVVAGAVVLSRIPSLQWPDAATDVPPKLHLVLVPLLVAWIGVLALSRRGISRALSSKWLVLGGFVSYSLYLTHTIWYGLWRAGMKVVGITGGPLYLVATAGLVVGAVFLGWLTWRFVEEPAREWMRAKANARRRPIDEPVLH